MTRCDADSVAPFAQRLTERLRLEPIGPEQAAELCRLHQDPGIALWYAGQWSRTEAAHQALAMGHQWTRDGVGKWLAYDLEDDALVGRGGLSRTRVSGRACLEVGWAVRQRLWGRGYATEIGMAALNLAFEELEADEVVSFTEVHNARSRRVMERLGMPYEGEINRPGLVAGGAGMRADAAFALYVLRREDVKHDIRQEASR